MLPPMVYYSHLTSRLTLTTGFYLMTAHRPISERMAELQQQMVALQVKQNKDKVNADPKVVAIDADIDALNVTALKWKRWEKDAEKKVRDFQARVAEWQHTRRRCRGMAC